MLHSTMKLGGLSMERKGERGREKGERREGVREGGRIAHRVMAQATSRQCVMHTMCSLA